MDNNELMMIVLAFVVGYMCSGMMKSMCGGRLVEGVVVTPSDCMGRGCMRKNAESCKNINWAKGNEGSPCQDCTNHGGTRRDYQTASTYSCADVF